MYINDTHTEGGKEKRENYSAFTIILKKSIINLIALIDVI